MSGDIEAERAQRMASVAALKEAGRTYREISAELGISTTTAWRDHEEWLKELRFGSPELRERAVAALAEQHDMLRTERLRLEMERDAVVAVLTAKHLTVSNGVIVRNDGEPIEDDGPVLNAVGTLNAIRDRLIKLADHEAKLLGLYSATKMAADVTVNYTVGGGVDLAALR